MAKRLQHGKVGIRLHRIADQRVRPGKGIGEYGVVARQRGGRIAIEGRADIFCDIGKAYRFGVQDAALIGEMMHWGRPPRLSQKPVKNKGFAGATHRGVRCLLFRGCRLGGGRALQRALAAAGGPR